MHGDAFVRRTLVSRGTLTPVQSANRSVEIRIFQRIKIDAFTCLSPRSFLEVVVGVRYNAFLSRQIYLTTKPMLLHGAQAVGRHHPLVRTPTVLSIDNGTRKIGGRVKREFCGLPPRESRRRIDQAQQ